MTLADTTTYIWYIYHIPGIGTQICGVVMIYESDVELYILGTNYRNSYFANIIIN